MAITVDNQHETIHAPKDEKTLEQIAEIRNKERKAMESEEEEEDKIKFLDDATQIAIDIPIEVVEPPIHLDFEELK
jgi:hypothetical protein